MSVITHPEIKRLSLRLEDVSGDPDERFEAAMSRAVYAAGKKALLLAWRDQIAGRFSPCTDCSEKCEPGGWEAYGKSRGADLRVDVDSGRYSFLFRTR